MNHEHELRFMVAVGPKFEALFYQLDRRHWLAKEFAATHFTSGDHGNAAPTKCALRAEHKSEVVVLQHKVVKFIKSADFSVPKVFMGRLSAASACGAK
jgi:hypothetical protein